MGLYEDDCIVIDLPDGWKPYPDDRGYYINLGNNTGLHIIFGQDDPDNPPQRIVAGFAEVFSKDLYNDPPSFKATVINPFFCGQHTGSRVDRDFGYQVGCYAGLIIEGKYVFAQTLGLTEEKNSLAWQAVATLRIKDGMPEAMRSRREAMLQPSPEEPEPKRLDATSLRKPRTKKLKTWMDHQMVLLMDSESHPEDDNPFVSAADVGFVMPCNEKALWVTSLTEFDVTLEFVVRATVLEPRKVWWQREAEATLSIPTGKLHVEQTTGGLLLEIELQPGDYRVIAHGSYSKGADASQEGVEKIQVVLVPVNDDSAESINE